MKIEGIHGVAGYFYYLTTKTRKGLYETLAEEIVSKIRSGRILDLGTGSGNLPVEIAKRASKLEIVGLDISKTLIKIAKNLAKREGVEGYIKFEVGTAYNLKFKDAYFDFVVSTGVIHHLNQPLKAFNEIYRVLKPQSEAWIYDLIRDVSFKEIVQTFKEMHIPLFPSIIFFRLHGLKYNEYYEKMAKYIKKSLFKSYKFEEKGCFMKIVLQKN